MLELYSASPTGRKTWSLTNQRTNKQWQQFVKNMSVVTCNLSVVRNMSVVTWDMLVVWNVSCDMEYVSCMECQLWYGMCQLYGICQLWHGMCQLYGTCQLRHGICQLCGVCQLWHGMSVVVWNMSVVIWNMSVAGNVRCGMECASGMEYVSCDMEYVSCMEYLSCDMEYVSCDLECQV